MVNEQTFGVSLWDNKESADAYTRGSYAEVAEILAKLVDGNSQVDTSEVSNSTFHKIGAAATALASRRFSLLGGEK